MITLELNAIQTLQPKISRKKVNVTAVYAYLTYTAGCKPDAGGSLFSTAGLVVGSTGAVGDDGSERMASAETRSFSISTPMFCMRES